MSAVFFAYYQQVNWYTQLAPYLLTHFLPSLGCALASH